MDMILLRQCAYRHLFLNRYLPCHYVDSPQRLWTDNNADTESTVDWGNMIMSLLQYDVKQNEKNKRPPVVLLILLVALTCFMLKMGLKFYQDDTKVGDGIEQQQQGYCPMRTSSFYPIAMSCVWEMMALWVGTIFTAIIMSMDATANNHHDFKNEYLNDICIRIDPDSSFYWKQLHFAVLTPQLFHFITLFVHIYENSYMVRILGKTFVFCFGYMAVGTIMEKRMKMMTKKEEDGMIMKLTKNKEIQTIEKRNTIIANYNIYGLPFVVGCILEMILSLYFSSSLDPCRM
jgi:hypothetical protein